MLKCENLLRLKKKEKKILCGPNKTALSGYSLWAAVSPLSEQFYKDGKHE